MPYLPMLLAAALFIIVRSSAVAHYFFLFDDFALVGESTRRSISQLWRDNLFGFFRPVVFTLVKFQSALFGWDHPAGYAIVSQLVHLANGALLAAVLRKAGLQVREATCAAALFILSPWAGETFAWVSCQFDLFAMLFYLIALWLALHAVSVAGRSVSLAFGSLAVLATALTGFSKESAVTLPPCLALLFLLRDRPFARTRALIMVLASGLAMAGVLFARSRVSKVFDGAYGNYFELLKKTRASSNVAQDVMSMLRPPFLSKSNAVSIAYLVVSVAAIFICLIRSPRTFAIAVGGLLVMCLPILPFPVTQGSSFGGRLLYMPAMWAVVLVGSGLANLSPAQSRQSLSLVQSVAATGALVLAAACSLSFRHQDAVWTRASRISESCVRQFGPWAHSSENVVISNLPFRFREGPYILRPYAFQYYYGQSPPIRATELGLSYSPMGTEVAWKEEGEWSQFRVDAKVQVVTFDLSVPRH